jgi:hypothetical protein
MFDGEHSHVQFEHQGMNICWIFFLNGGQFVLQSTLSWPLVIIELGCLN